MKQITENEVGEIKRDFFGWHRVEWNKEDFAKAFGIERERGESNARFQLKLTTLATEYFGEQKEENKIVVHLGASDKNAVRFLNERIKEINHVKAVQEATNSFGNNLMSESSKFPISKIAADALKNNTQVQAVSSVSKRLQQLAIENIESSGSSNELKTKQRNMMNLVDFDKVSQRAIQRELERQKELELENRKLEASNCFFGR